MDLILCLFCLALCITGASNAAHAWGGWLVLAGACIWLLWRFVFCDFFAGYPGQSTQTEPESTAQPSTRPPWTAQDASKAYALGSPGDPAPKQPPGDAGRTGSERKRISPSQDRTRQTSN